MDTQFSADDMPPERTTRFKRVAWFVGLWIAGVLSMAVVAYVIRWAFQH